MTNVSSFKVSDEMTALMARLAMSTSKRENLNIAGEFGKLIERVIEQEERAAGNVTPERAITATIRFKREECAGMDKAFKKLFSECEYCARVIKRQSGKNTFLYEIRFRRGGYKIEVSSTDIKEAKRKFLAVTTPENIDDCAVAVQKSGLNLFKEVAAEWLTYKQGKVCERTYKYYESCYRRYIRPALGEKPIATIRTLDVDKILTGKGARLYEDLRTVCNSVFKYAIGSGVVTYNPVTLIPFIKSERQSERRALTNDEQKKLVERLSLPEYVAHRQTFLIMLYCGLRPCEVDGARFEGDFLITRNAKRKNGRIEYKKIPLSEQAKEKLDLSAPVSCPHRTEVLNRIFKRIIGDDSLTQYTLRHTFATTCQQYVRPDIVDIWMGDSSERLVGRVYTHFSDEFMCNQMQKVTFGA